MYADPRVKGRNKTNWTKALVYIGKISTVCLVAFMDVQVYRNMIDKQDFLKHFDLLHTILTGYRGLLSYKIFI